LQAFFDTFWLFIENVFGFAAISEYSFDRESKTLTTDIFGGEMDQSELTAVQQRLLDVIRESMISRNYAPSMR